MKWFIGVLAIENIPEGTIAYVKDSLELVVSPTDYLLHCEEVKEAIEKYSYIDQSGNRVISWDFAKLKSPLFTFLKWSSQ